MSFRIVDAATGETLLTCPGDRVDYAREMCANWHPGKSLAAERLCDKSGKWLRYIEWPPAPVPPSPGEEQTEGKA